MMSFAVLGLYTHTSILTIGEYIMLSLYDKVENTKQTNLFMQQLHSLEAHYSKQRK